MILLYISVQLFCSASTTKARGKETNANINLGSHIIKKLNLLRGICCILEGQLKYIPDPNYFQIIHSVKLYILLNACTITDNYRFVKMFSVN